MAINYEEKSFMEKAPGLVVMGGDSHPRWTFFTFICYKNCNVCLKRPKINEEEAVNGQLKITKPISAEIFFLC